ncbi:amino acid ABC transporter ATP-binding/permease protein [Brevundimonas sp.]
MSPRTRVSGMIAAQIAAQRGRLRIAATAGAVVSVAAVCLLGLSGWFITGAAIAGLAGVLAAQTFNYMMPSAIIRLLAILRTGARYMERVAGHEAALKALARLRPQLFEGIARSPLSKALGVSSGETSARLVQDVDAVQTLFVRRSAPWSLGSGAVSAVALAALASPVAGALLLVAMAAASLGSALIAQRLADPAGRAVQATVGVFKDRLSALEAVAPELKAYGLDAWAVAEVETVAADHDRAQVALTRAGGWITLWQAAATALAVGSVVTVSAGASVPLVALAALASVMGMECAAGLASALHQNGAAEQALNRLNDLLVQDPATRRHMPLQPAIRLAASAETHAPPMRLGILGPSGSGKTTLVERLIGLRETPAGVASLSGLDIADLAPAERRALFAYAAQDVRLMDGTVRENLLLAGPATDDALWAALDDAALAERFRRAPEGLDARIGPNGRRLSGGERRRLGLARAYLRDAPWLVLDEPTEGLDAATEARVLAALDLRLDVTGQGLILISHRAPPLAVCGRLFRMSSGAADATGPARITAVA